MTEHEKHFFVNLDFFSKMKILENSHLYRLVSVKCLNSFSKVSILFCECGINNQDYMYYIDMEDGFYFESIKR